jgi:serine/threonine protein kinase
MKSLPPSAPGGMGEAYRPTDGNLKRSVASKVLPASVAGDADRLARFQREAEVLASLNHPNIAADGQRVLMTQPISDSSDTPVTVSSTGRSC